MISSKMKNPRDPGFGIWNVCNVIVIFRLCRQSSICFHSNPRSGLSWNNPYHGQLHYSRLLRNSADDSQQPTVVRRPIAWLAIYNPQPVGRVRRQPPVHGSVARDWWKFPANTQTTCSGYGNNYDCLSVRSATLFCYFLYIYFIYWTCFLLMKKLFCLLFSTFS